MMIICRVITRPGHNGLIMSPDIEAAHLPGPRSCLVFQHEGEQLSNYAVFQVGSSAVLMPGDQENIATYSDHTDSKDTKHQTVA